jgi:hypothetical protein
MELVGLTLAALLALPAFASANTSGPIALTGGMTTTIPLLGSPLRVALTLDVVGNVSNVDLDPVGTFAATSVGPHAVSFANADGTTQVKIKARGNRMSMKASSASLNDLVGKGTWSADVFGTSQTTEVAYTIGVAGDGSPTLAIDSVCAPTGVVVDQQAVETKANDHGSSASARIDFSQDGFVKKLSIRVSLRNDGDRPANVSFELSGKDRQKLSGTLDELLGAHAWTGVACDGSPATVRFTVNADGTVSFVGATPTATVQVDEDGFKARFDGAHAAVRVSLSKKEDGTWSLKVEAATDQCADTPAVAPTVNTPVQAGAVHSDHQGDSENHGDSGNHDGKSGSKGGSGSRGDGGNKDRGSGGH